MHTQPATPADEQLQQFYAALTERFGPQHWWPARTRLEIILGAILTQNTAWRNAARAIKSLRAAGLLKWRELRKASPAELEDAVRPAGFYRRKAKAIRNFLDWLERVHGGSLHKAFAIPPGELRRQLLEIKGLGPETADAILLYAGRRPFFVADAYTRRILSRHGLLPDRSSYDEAQRFLHEHLPQDQSLFNDFHALLVVTGKEHCRRRAPKCDGCPLERYLPQGRPLGWQESDSSRRPRAAALAVEVETA